MAITSYSQPVRHGHITTVTVTSGLGGTVYYHWYMDGQYVASTLSPSYSFYLERGEEVSIVCQDTNDAAYDPIANAPAGYPSRRSVYWICSTDSDVGSYKVEQKAGAGSWETIGLVTHDDAVWQYSILTPRLTDLTQYQWRVTPVDLYGNEGTALEIDSMKVVRKPDAVDFTRTFDSGTTKVTFSAA